MKCEPYDQNSKEILYFAFDKRYIWSNYDPINSEFRNRSKAKYGERYVTAIWDNIKINREEGTIIITPSLALIFLDLFKKEETKDLVLNCEKVNKRDLSSPPPKTVIPDLKTEVDINEFYVPSLNSYTYITD